MRLRNDSVTVINVILDIVAILICLAGLIFLGFIYYALSILLNFTWWDFAGMVAVVAFVLWRAIRWW